MSPAHSLSMFMGDRRRGGTWALFAGGKLAILRSVMPGPGEGLAGEPPLGLVNACCIGCPCELRLRRPSTALDILSCSLSVRSTLSDMLVGPRASVVTLVCMAGIDTGGILTDDTAGGGG